MKSISILIALILPSILLSQSNIKFSLGREYWQHTRLWGLHTGLEFSYPINKKFNVHLGVGYGYGEKNRLYEFPLIKDNFSTLYVGFYPGYEFEYGFERTQTDNAKQFKLFSGVSYDFRISMKQKLSFQSNIFGQKVHHFFVVDKLRDGHEIDYGRVFIGPFDVYIVELNPASAGYAFKNTRFFLYLRFLTTKIFIYEKEIGLYYCRTSSCAGSSF